MKIPIRRPNKKHPKNLSTKESIEYLKDLLQWADNEKKIARLRHAYQNGNLALYLGAGVSLGNGLPSWERLVLSMYFSALELRTEEEPVRPYANYLFAIAEWHLKGRREPLDITARKIRRHYKKREFLTELKSTLYAGFKSPWGRDIQTPNINRMLATNGTLKSIVTLCASSTSGAQRPVQSIITYNYDNLLELGFQGKVKHQPIWKANQRVPYGALPIYHVHGYVPIDQTGSNVDEIIFTEDQYHRVAQDAYSWSNLVQIRTLSNYIGLMVGISLSDRNMRRLLDAIRNAPVNSENYILLQTPKLSKPSKREMQEIDRNARKYFKRFTESGIKTEDRRFQQIGEIIEGVEAQHLKEQTSVLEELGVSPIWYKEHSDIPLIIERIISVDVDNRPNI